MKKIHLILFIIPVIFCSGFYQTYPPCDTVPYGTACTEANGAITIPFRNTTDEERRQIEEYNRISTSRFGFTTADFYDHFESFMEAQRHEFGYDVSVERSEYFPEKYPYVNIMTLPYDVYISLYTDRNNNVKEIIYYTPIGGKKEEINFRSDAMCSILFSLFPEWDSGDYLKFIRETLDRSGHFDTVDVYVLPETINNIKYETYCFFEG